jgi:ketosteroid isomerase-like protein
MTNAEIVGGFYDAVGGGDLEGGLALLAPDCTWREMDGFPYRGTYRGPAEVREQVFYRLGSDWKGFSFALDEVLDAGDAVVAVGTYSGTYRATGKPMSARVVHLWRLRDGKAVSFEQFADTLRVAESMEG